MQAILIELKIAKTFKVLPVALKTSSTIIQNYNDYQKTDVL